MLQAFAPLFHQLFLSNQSVVQDISVLNKDKAK